MGVLATNISGFYITDGEKPFDGERDVLAYFADYQCSIIVNERLQVDAFAPAPLTQQS